MKGGNATLLFAAMYHMRLTPGVFAGIVCRYALFHRTKRAMEG